MLAVVFRKASRDACRGLGSTVKYVGVFLALKSPLYYLGCTRFARDLCKVSIAFAHGPLQKSGLKQRMVFFLLLILR